MAEANEESQEIQEPQVSEEAVEETSEEPVEVEASEETPEEDPVENNRRRRADPRTRRQLRAHEQRQEQLIREREAAKAEAAHWKNILEEAKGKITDTEGVLDDLPPPPKFEVEPSGYVPTESEIYAFENAAAALGSVHPDYVQSAKEKWPELIGAIRGLRNPSMILDMVEFVRREHKETYYNFRALRVSELHETFREMEIEDEVRRRLEAQAPAKSETPPAKKKAAKKQAKKVEADEGDGDTDAPEPVRTQRASSIQDGMSDFERQIDKLKRERAGQYVGMAGR